MRKILGLMLLLLSACLPITAEATDAFAPQAGKHYLLREKSTGKCLQLETPAAKVGNNDGDFLAGLSDDGSELVFVLRNGSQTEYAIQCAATEAYLSCQSWNSVINATTPCYWTFEAQQDGQVTYYRVHQSKAGNGNISVKDGYLKINTEAIFVDGNAADALLFELEEVLPQTSKTPLIQAIRDARAQIGTQPGQYSQQAVDDAQAVVDDEQATDAEIDNAIARLRAAAVQLQVGNYYRFCNTVYGSYISVNDGETHLQSREDNSNDPRQIWKLEERGGKMYLRNLYTQLYPQDIVGGTANTSAVGALNESKNFSFQLYATATARTDAAWNLKVGGSQINCEANGNLNKWDGDNAHFYAYQVEETEQELQAMADEYVPEIKVQGHGPAKNYALRFTEEGSVDCGKMTELSGRTTWSVQFWLAPDQWTQGARVFSRGDNFSVAINGDGTLGLTVGETIVANAACGLKKHLWNHVSLIVKDGILTSVVNGNVSEQVATLPAIPESEENLVLGGNLRGRLDELRFWRSAVSATFNYFVSTTLNPFQTAWKDLLAYYKFDMTECEHVVDFKGISVKDGALHHGLMSAAGVRREQVNDNAGLPYLLCGAYSNNERFFDRSIPREQYLLANDLIFLGIQSYSGGRAFLKSPNAHATFSGGCQRKSISSSRYGVMQFDGTGLMTVPFDGLLPVGQGMAVETWLYLDEWTEGAVLFEKMNDEGTCNFRISLGSATGKMVNILCNGKTWTARTTLATKKWQHLGISTVLGTPEGFIVAVGAQSVTATPPDNAPGVGIGFGEDCKIYVGRNLKGKIDDYVTWNRSFTAAEMQQHGTNGLIKMSLGGGNSGKAVLFRAGAAFTFADADNPGYDSYSQDEWTRVMTAAYRGHKNWQMRLAVESHNGWSSTINNAQKRESMARDIVACIDDKYAGVEFDLEWAYAAWELDALGKLVQRVRELLPEGKTVHLSIHGRSIGIVPQQYWPYIDGFTVQQYGPQADNYQFSKYQSQYNDMISRGLPPEKLYLSWATITSSGSAGGAVQGLAWNFYPSDQLVLVKEDKETKEVNGNTYSFAGPWQTYQRAKFATEHQAQGIFYWDMGNDMPLSNPNNLARHCNYGLSANTDTLVTNVPLDASVKGSDPDATAIGRVGAPESQTLSVRLDGRNLSLALQEGTLTRVILRDAAGASVLRSLRVQRSLNLSSLSAGVYIVEAYDSFGRRYVRKIALE